MTTIVGKKRNPRTLDPALFLGKTRKNTPEVKLVEKSQNILKNSEIYFKKSKNLVGRIRKIRKKLKILKNIPEIRKNNGET